MARRTIVTSDLTGLEIPEGKLVKLTITCRERHYRLEADMTEDVIKELMSAAGQSTRKRGRKSNAERDAAQAAAMARNDAQAAMMGFPNG